MHSFKKLPSILAGLIMLASPTMAQPVPGGGPYQPGPAPESGPMPPPYHPHHPHHWQHYGYGPPPGGWRQGEQFYGPPPVIIRNYGYYSLTPPPPGYYWVQSGDQFLMIAIASGIIASILTMPMH